MGSLYKTARWQQLRRIVLNRHPICQGVGCMAIGIDVDHIDGDTSNNDLTNLQSLCHACHSAKTARHDRPSKPSTKPLRGHDASGLPLGANGW